MDATTIRLRNNISIQYGVIAGVIMALYLFFFQYLDNDYSPGLKFGKYIVLAICIVLGLNKFKPAVGKRFFQSGLFLGTRLTTIAAIIVVIVHILLYIIQPDLSFSKYTLFPENPGKMFAIGGLTFVEIFVFGNILTFLTLQFLKEKSRD